MSIVQKLCLWNHKHLNNNTLAMTAKESNPLYFKVIGCFFYLNQNSKFKNLKSNTNYFKYIYLCFVN